jgi:hypothetical protein
LNCAERSAGLDSCLAKLRDGIAVEFVASLIDAVAEEGYELGRLANGHDLESFAAQAILDEFRICREFECAGLFFLCR